MIIGFIGSKKLTIVLLLLSLIIVLWEGVTRQVPAQILFITGSLLAANLVCCIYMNAVKLGKFSTRQAGFILFHAGLLFIILGGMVSYYTYSIAYVEVAEGNAFSDERSSYSGWKQRFGVRAGTGIKIGIEKIHLTFWENGQIKEYTNRLSIKDGNRKTTALLEVNGSVKHRGLLINLARYYGLAPHFVLETPEGKSNAGYVYISDTRKTNTFTIPTVGYKATVVYENITDRSVVISIDEAGTKPITRTIVPGDAIDLGGARLKLTGISLWNGITIVHDKGKGITFTGFALFMAGLSLYYYSRFFRRGTA